MTLGTKRASAIGALILVLGLLVFSQSIVSPRYDVPVTDFGRDVAGAQAAIHGVNPYQQLGDLEVTVPNLSVPEDAEQFWVAHSPLSVAIARVAFHTFGEATVDVAKIAVVVSSVGVIAWILLGVGTMKSAATRMALAGAVAMSLGIESDLLWVQGASLLALALGTLMSLLRRDRQWPAVVVLGFIVAWRPWCAPLALFLPKGRAWWNAAGTALAATATTVVCASFIGGSVALRSWFTDALPQNTEAYLRSRWNLSVTGPYLGIPLALLIFGSLIAVGLFMKRRLTDDNRLRIGSTAILGFFPIVWAHYWTALITVVAGRKESQAVVLAYLCLAVPLVGESPEATTVGAVASLLLMGSVVRSSIKHAAPGGPGDVGLVAKSGLRVSGGA